MRRQVRPIVVVIQHDLDREVDPSIQVEIGRKEVQVVVEDEGALTMGKLREMSPSEMKGSRKRPWRSSSSVSVSIVSP